jgi:hypothetical protein
MKKIISLLLTIALSNTLYGQENYRKCNTTNLVVQELKDNNDYALAREESKFLKNNFNEKVN